MWTALSRVWALDSGTRKGSEKEGERGKERVGDGKVDSPQPSRGRGSQSNINRIVDSMGQVKMSDRSYFRS